MEHQENVWYVEENLILAKLDFAKLVGSRFVGGAVVDGLMVNIVVIIAKRII